MVKRIGVFCFILMFMFMCITPSLCVQRLSYGIDVLLADRKLTKTSYNGEAVFFTAEDFSRGAGLDDISEITVVSLPKTEDGVLKLGTLDAFSGQKISKRALSQLRFIPSENNSRECSFSYRVDSQDADVICVINFCDGENESPSVESMKLHTAKNISVYATLNAKDDTDGLSYEILSQPRRGLLTFEDESAGYIKYTPSDNYVGTDSFRYRVIDKYGKASGEASVTVKIEKMNSDFVYSDMENHPSAYAASKLAKEDILVGEKIGNLTVFNPSKKVSRLEFLVMAMKSADYSPNVFVKEKTSFEDDERILSANKGYVVTAEMMGIVDSNEEKCFRPDDAITYGEAAMILSRILDLKYDSGMNVFFPNKTDFEDAIQALSAIGITSGNTLDKEVCLDRATAALLLEGVIRN